MTGTILNNRIERAENFLKMQRKRNLFFSDNLIFDDPAWELLLEIYIATQQNKCISEKKVNESLSAPSSIVVRWINVFADRRYLIRCEKDGEECLQLTDRARDQCHAYLDAISDT